MRALLAGRSSWSHDDGQRIFFDAWVNRYTTDGRYPMCTTEFYPRPDRNGQVTVEGVIEPIRRGHTMWLAHLDLVLSRQREAVLINPVPREPGRRQGDKGAKGWLPRYTTGLVIRDNDEIWFESEAIITLELDEVVEWPAVRTQQVEDRRTQALDASDDALAAAKALLQQHIAETTALLARLP